MEEKATQADPPAPVALQDVGIQVNAKEIDQLQEQMLLDKLAEMEPYSRRQFLGEMLYPVVKSLLPANCVPHYAGKVTGMILEWDARTVLNLLHNREELRSSVQEAIGVLVKHKWLPQPSQ